MGKNEINLADNLLNIINTARENALKKVNEELISMYWQVGEYLHKEAQKSTFGESYIDSVTPLVTQISWTNHLLIMSGCKSDEEREFYIRLCVKEKYSR